MTASIPRVREQIKQWTTSRSDDEVQRESIAASDLTVLGTVRRSTFASTRDGRQLKLRGPVMPHELERATSDAVLVTKPGRDGQGRSRTDVFIGRVVEPGTFERTNRRYRPKERRAGPVDGLADLRKPSNRLPVLLGKDDPSPEGIILGALSKRPMMLVTDGRDAPRTVRSLVELANKEGANLRQHNGRVLADWTNVRRWRPLLIAAWPLVEAHVLGSDLVCAYEHEAQPPVADTLDPAGVAVCDKHIAR